MPDAREMRGNFQAARAATMLVSLSVPKQREIGGSGSDSS